MVKVMAINEALNSYASPVDVGTPAGTVHDLLYNNTKLILTDQ
jgi:hypothetical protein